MHTSGRVNKTSFNNILPTPDLWNISFFKISHIWLSNKFTFQTVIIFVGKNARQIHIYFVLCSVFQPVWSVYNSNHVKNVFFFSLLDLPNAQGLAVDWISRNLFWTSYDTNKKQINVAHMDGSFKNAVIHGLDKPHGLVLHPILGLVQVLTHAQLLVQA